LSLGRDGFSRSDQWVATRLGEVVNERTEPPGDVSVLALIGSGLSVYSYYFMADRILELDPDQVVVQLNLFWLSKGWHRSIDRSVLAAWLPLAWWQEALRLPLHATTLTTDRWLLYRALFTLGLVGEWHRLQREQARLAEAYWSLAAWTQRMLSSPEGLGFRLQHKLAFGARRRDMRDRATPLSARELLGPAVDGVEDDQFLLRMLDALLGRLHDADISAVVYVPPHNVEHLDGLGLLNREGLDRTLAAIESVVHRRGGRFVDLHDEFADEGFRDFLDHYVDSPEREGSLLIAEKLAPEVLEAYWRHKRMTR
jgi:hypothetical protein